MHTTRHTHEYTAGRARTLHVHPRDQFDNPAPLATVSARCTLHDTHTTHTRVHRGPCAHAARAPARPVRQPGAARHGQCTLHMHTTRHTHEYTAGRARTLHVHPRDQFDNPAPLATVSARCTLHDTHTTHTRVHRGPRAHAARAPARPVRQPGAARHGQCTLHTTRHTHDTHTSTPRAVRARCTCIRATSSTTRRRSPRSVHAAHYTTHTRVHRGPRAHAARAPARPVRQPGAARHGQCTLHTTRHTHEYTAGRARTLHVHPRDQFDNPAPLATVSARCTCTLHDTHTSTPRAARARCTCTRATSSTTRRRSPRSVHAAHYTTHTRHTHEYTAGRARTLHVHPRDQFDNPGLLATGFTIEIRVVGGEVDEKLSSAATFQYDSVNQRVAVEMCFPEPGVYRAAIFYDGVLLHNGEFDCIVLTAGEAASVQRACGRRAHAAFEARLLAPGRPRRLLLALSAKHLLLKDYVLKFIPKRITTFRLCPSTKLTLLPRIGPGPGGEFTLDDGVQPAMRLSSPQRDLLAATFTQLLIANCGGEDSFKNKQEFFYSEMRKAHARYPHEKLSVRVLRTELLRSSLKATRHFTIADWCKNFDVSFQGEQGVDWGGVRREWFSLVCAQLFDAKFGLFVPFRDSPTALVHPNPDRPPHLKLKHFEFAGKLVGKCLYESALGGSYRQLVRARLTRSFLAQIIGLRVHYKYFEQDDPELYLSKIKYVLDTDLDAEDALELTFSEDVYDSSGHLVETHDLVPNGSSIRVNNSNKTQYLEALAQWRLAARVRLELAAFLRGLQLLVPHHLLAIFDENELELLVCGTGELCAADWRAHALVAGAGRDWQRRLAWFWAALASLSGEERARLLQFCTGCSQLPPGGFQELNPRFQITAAPTFGALPTAHTCFNQLCLPDYDSYEQMVHALLWAINEGGEGFGMI
ncbi:unnamed protein product [Parnassius mnemosyne]|uniref:HECT-type E3 ubiquitin transferase n=1 Tax=Parnassius mnemosyne TaxID=213953 RepID=A0AAV1M2J0_9NEOP